MSTSPSPTAKNPAVEAFGKQIQMFANSYADWRLGSYAKWLATQESIILYGKVSGDWTSVMEANLHAQFQAFTAEYQAIHSRIAALWTNQRSDEPCTWRLGDDEYWHGPCGAAWRFDDGDTTPTTLVKFCPECGRRLEVLSEDAQP